MLGSSLKTMTQTTKQWIKNWLKDLEDTEKKHEERKDKVWITSNEAVSFMEGAKNIFDTLLKEE